MGPRSKGLTCRPNFLRGPWLAMVLIFIVVACMGASACIIIISDKQPVTSWKTQPTVLLAVSSSVLNVALSTALSISVAVAWWRSALHGTTLARLHHIWCRGLGQGFSISAPFKSFDVGKVVLVAVIVAVVKFANAPLLQRATQIRVQDFLTNDTMKLDLTRQLPDGWMGTVQNASASGITISGYGLSAFQSWWWNRTITSYSSKPGYYCSGTCEGRVQGAGISHSCNSTTEFLDLSTTKNNGAVIFSINFTMPESSPGIRSLLLTTLYSSAISHSCVATLTIDKCNIGAAVVEYPITIQNTTVTLINDKLKDIAVVSTYTSPGDLPTASEGDGAGPLLGLFGLFDDYLFANITEGVDPSQDSFVYGASVGSNTIANLFYYPEASSYDNHTFEKCGLKWSSPTDYVLSSMKDFMFRAALRAGNGTETQTFAVQRTSPTLVFHSEDYYLAISLALMFLALLAILCLLWGWWELDRPVSLSPLETANAFGAPIMKQTGANLQVEEILDEVGDMKVKYDGGTEDDGSGIRRDHRIRQESGGARISGENASFLMNEGLP